MDLNKTAISLALLANTSITAAPFALTSIKADLQPVYKPKSYKDTEDNLDYVFDPSLNNNPETKIELLLEEPKPLQHANGKEIKQKPQKTDEGALSRKIKTALSLHKSKKSFTNGMVHRNKDAFHRGQTK